LDELDAKVTAVRTFIEADDPEAPWTSYHKVLERFFFKGKQDSADNGEDDHTEAKEKRQT
jgi:3'-5' exoribonuclease